MNPVAVVGLEIHARIQTGRKLFCGCPVREEAPPNSTVCPVCMGYPGTLPVPDRQAAALAIDLALALHMTIHRNWQFVRKNYFYPDLPKGYQITMMDHPVATGGFLQWHRQGRAGKTRLRRLHLEEDAARLIHDEPFCPDSMTLIDFNRCGMPLLELVTEPETLDVGQVDDMLHYYQALLRTLKISDADMEKGHLRIDVNVSLPDFGSSHENAPVEIKNVNSFHMIRKAIQAEIHRQRTLKPVRGRVHRETRRYNPVTDVSEHLRFKESLSDYRYFPEPDLPGIEISESFITSRKNRLPDPPETRFKWLAEELCLKKDYAEFLSMHPPVFDRFCSIFQCDADPREAAHYVMQTERMLQARFPEKPMPEPSAIARVLNAVIRGIITRKAAAEVCVKSVESNGSPDHIFEEYRDAPQITDDTLKTLVESVMSGFADELAAYQSGKRGLFGFFMGRILAAAPDSIDPVRVKAVLERYISSNN